MTHTCDDSCVGKQEGGRGEVGSESPVVHDNQPVCPPPAARSELEKDVPHAVSYRVARKEHVALYASVLVRAESLSVHGTTSSVNQAAHTCAGLIHQGGINRLQNLVGGHPKNPAERLLWCERTPRSTDIRPQVVAPVTLKARL